MLKLFNTLSRTEEEFIPLDKNRVGMYVCGPTVYDDPHIGNARSAIVYDLLFRVLRYIYGENNVVYVRNITDVDDKIIKAAKDRNLPIYQLTEEVTANFHKDMSYLGCLAPTVEPRATTHIKEMIEIINRLINNGYAYKANNHVYFDVTKYQDYTKLSRRSLDDMLSEVRVDHSEGKRNPHDFVLWKPKDNEDSETSVFNSPFGEGRPGWHIECSAMSSKYLGNTFDIHGGGADLMFPHHTNEIAQSCCAFDGSKYARYWVHNGFVTVGGEKMSKSLKNFITVRQLREHDNESLLKLEIGQKNEFQTKSIEGAVVRFALLSTHYRKPLDVNDKLLQDSAKALEKFSRSLISDEELKPIITAEFAQTLCDDLNVSTAIAYMHKYADEALERNSLSAKSGLLGAMELLNIKYSNQIQQISDEQILKLIEERNLAKKNKDFAISDKIRNELLNQGIILEDTKDGTRFIKKLI